MIKILFFAQTRELLDCNQLTQELSADTSVKDLKKQLQQKSALWHDVLSAELLCAVNQNLVAATSIIKDGDEVAFFPPVTGG